MTRRRIFAVAGVMGLSLLLAGCAGLFQNPVVPPTGGVGVAPAEAGATLPLDYRALGETVIPPDAQYFPDRIIVGYENNERGRKAHEKVMSLVGASTGPDVVLDNLWIVQINLKPGLTVPEALGIVMCLATGKLDPEMDIPSGIVFAEPDYIIPPPEPIPGPTEVASLAPKVYDPNADLRPFQWALDAINAEAAWALGYTGRGIVIAVMDTGVDGTHPDLQGQLVDGIEVRNMTALPATSNSDTDNHGTHVAGIIAAKNDGKGVVGLAYNAKIMPVRIFDPSWIGTVNYLRGVKWAVDHPTTPAKILSNSWGGAAYSQAVKAAVDYALSRNVIVVVSAGNDTYALWRRPASIPGVIAVAATDPHNRKATFSTPGTWVSVGAPGVRVLSSVRSQTTQAGTGLPLLYDYYDGTSMACPYVSALAALILEKHPTATPYQVKKLIESTAKDIGPAGFDPGTGHGLIQADKALTSALPPDNSAALRIHVVTASSEPLWGTPFPVPYMDITLRKDGRIIGVGQTDYEGWYYVGFPTGDYPPEWGLGYFPILEPGTYEVLVGGDDAVLFSYRTANRVTAKTTVTLTAGGVATLTIPVNTTLTVTLTWSGGGADTLIDLCVEEPYGVGWVRASSPGPYGTWTSDQSGASGTETYTLNAVHGDYSRYRLAVEWVGGTKPTSCTVTVTQNGVTEVYTVPLGATPGWYYAYLSPTHRWTNWWDTVGGPWVF